MKANFQKGISFTMAVLVLLSTISWTVDKHLCMGRVMDIAFFVDAYDCGMEAAVALLENESENHCCGDESFTLEGQDDLNLTWSDFDFDQQVFLVAFVHSYSQSTILHKKIVQAEQYLPPILVNDIQLLDGVFLI